MRQQKQQVLSATEKLQLAIQKAFSEQYKKGVVEGIKLGMAIQGSKHGRK